MRVSGVVAGDEQDVAARGSSSFVLSTPLALIQKRVSSLRCERLPYERPPMP